MDKRNQPQITSESDDTSHPKPAAAGSTIVFYGDPAQVSAGFALALQLMGMDAEMPDAGEHDLRRKGKS
ncbi:hypothetical protein JQ628_24375 [Bradyrhizobium lablabi]|uniref:hypothetical protein n=1 Tax=Bradyrhizobium lablabi TaxID=722472 RepID=UPI001BA47809|nr:hypothetical protein [Bradyrhizobium lablabi]MBR1124682.1 hypothetical protein [Bradyrhizobium lablabi]